MNNLVYTTIKTTSTLDPGYNSVTLDATAGSIVLTLYDAVAYDARTIYLNRFDLAPGNKVTIQGTGGQTVDNQPTYDMVSGANLLLLAQGGKWTALGNNQTTSAAVNTGNIVDGAVTFVKIQKIAANTILGNPNAFVDTVTNLSSLPYALTGGDVTAPANSNVLTIGNLKVTNAMLGNLSVSTGKIQDDAVITTKILDANVTTAKIADANVTTAKIADSNVTTAKIADANVTTAKIADSNVTTAKIADNNVTTAKILDANVTYAKIQNVAANSILGNKTGAPGAVTDLQALPFAHTGDVTSVANSNALTIANTGVSAGLFHLPTFQVNAKGQIVSPPQIVSNFGNVALVDALNGADSGQTLNAQPFKTIGAAITAASAVANSTVYVMPGTYSNETLPLTMQPKMSLVGLGRQSVTIEKTAAVVNTTLFAMSTENYVNFFTFNLTSVSNVSLTAISFPSTSSTNSTLGNCSITVSGAATNPNTVVGIAFSGTGAATTNFMNVETINMNISNTGTGDARGVLCSGTSTSIMSKANILCNNSNATGTSVAAQTGVGTALSVRRCTLSGTASGGGTAADIAPFATATMTMICSNMISSKSLNNIGFNMSVTPSFLAFGENGVMTKNVTQYYYAGTFVAQNTEVQMPIPNRCMCRAIFAIVNTASATGSSSTFTVRNAKVSTLVSCKITGPAATASSDVNCATFNAGDLLSLQVITDNVGTPAQSPQILLAFY